MSFWVNVITEMKMATMMTENAFGKHHHLERQRATSLIEEKYRGESDGHSSLLRRSRNSVNGKSSTGSMDDSGGNEGTPLTERIEQNCINELQNETNNHKSASIRNNGSSLTQLNDSVHARPDSLLSPMTKSAEKLNLSSGQKLLKVQKGRFYKVFPEIAETDVVIKTYHCALVSDILLQGFLFVTSRWFCFHSKLMGKKRIKIPVSLVTNITKKKTAIIIPNAICIATESEKFLFGSLMSRDNTYELMLEVWKQNQHDNEEKLSPKSLDQQTNSSDDSSDSYCSNLDNSCDQATLLSDQNGLLSEHDNISGHGDADPNPASPLRGFPDKSARKTTCLSVPNVLFRNAFVYWNEIMSWMQGMSRSGVILFICTILVFFLLLSAVMLAYKLILLQTTVKANIDWASGDENFDSLHHEAYYLRHEFHYAAIQKINAVLESHITMLDQINQAVKGLQQLASQRCSNIDPFYSDLKTDD